MTRRTPPVWSLPLAALALILGILLGRDATSVLPGCLALAAAILSALLTRGKFRMAAVLLAVMSLGFARGYIAYHPQLPPEGDYQISGTICETPRLREEDGQVRTMLQDVTLDGTRIAGGSYWSFYLKDGESLPVDLLPGCRVTFRASVYHPEGQENPGGYNFREYLLQQGMTIGAYGRHELVVEPWAWDPTALAARIRYAVSTRMREAFGDGLGGYASTMLLGAQYLIPEEDRDAFNRLGISHILSISGYHVGVLAMVLSGFLKKRKLSLPVHCICMAVMLGCYALLTGANPPVIRAAILLVLLQSSKMAHRAVSRLHLLSLTAMLMLLYDPVQLTGASFQLSYGAMLGIMLITPVVKKKLNPQRTEYVKRSFCFCIGAQIGVLLPQLYWFHELPMFALPLNLLILTLFPWLMCCFWIMLFLLPFGPLADLLGSLIAWLTQHFPPLLSIVSQTNGLMLWTPQANVLTLIGWAVLLWSLSTLCTRSRRIPGLIGTGILCLSLIPLPSSAVTYTQLSVGNADAAVLQDHDQTIAIDTGESSTLAEYLHQRRLSLDALILTHLHTDHAGGVAALLAEHIPVHTLYLPEGAMEMDAAPEVLALIDQLLQRGTRLITIARGDVIPLSSGSITVMWPESGRIRTHQEANLYSAVLRLDLLGTSLLTTGDIPGSYEAYAAAPADILKIAHHGSASSTGSEFLSALDPGIALLSCNADDRVQDVALRTGDIPLYATATDGAIIIDFTPQQYTVRTMR